MVEWNACGKAAPGGSPVAVSAVTTGRCKGVPRITMRSDFAHSFFCAADV